MQLPAPLRTLAAEPRRAAVILDVDGTLAPIVARPEDARVPPETQHELRRLWRRYGLLACVTGRTSEDAARVVGVAEVPIVGEHGLELSSEAHEWAARIAAFADAFSDPVPERKRLTVSYHVRVATDEAGALARLEALAHEARARGLVPRFGRKVLEVRPPVSADKGTAVAALLEDARLSRGLYAGDDTTDVDAFRALAAIDVGVSVAVLSDESHPDLREAADVTVEGPAGLLELLRLM